MQAVERVVEAPRRAVRDGVGALGRKPPVLAALPRLVAARKVLRKVVRQGRTAVAAADKVAEALAAQGPAEARCIASSIEVVLAAVAKSGLLLAEAVVPPTAGVGAALAPDMASVASSETAGQASAEALHAALSAPRLMKARRSASAGKLRPRRRPHLEVLSLLVRLAERLENAPFGAQVVQSRALIGTLPEARR